MPYFPWRKIFSIFGWSFWRCQECSSIYLRRRHKRHKRIWGHSCREHTA